MIKMTCHDCEFETMCKNAYEYAPGACVHFSHVAGRPKAYISGRITGEKNYKEIFERAKEHLENKGFVVLNPAVLPDGLSLSEYMKIDVAMLDAADYVFFLPNWKYSKGAQVEKAYAEYVGKQIVYLEGNK